MKRGGKIILSLTCGMIGAWAYSVLMRGNQGGINPLNVILLCAYMVAIRFGNGPHQPNEIAGWSFLVVVFSLLAFTAITIADRIYKRARDQHRNR
jgi:hypothetical protein